MSDGMEAVRDTLRKADEALRKASEPSSEYVGSTSAFKTESPPAPPNPEPQRRSPSVPPERPSSRYSPVSMNDSWRSPLVPQVIPSEAYTADLHSSAPRMYNSMDGARLNVARHRSVSPMRAAVGRDRLANVRTETASTEFLSPQALDYLKASGNASQPIRAGPLADVPQSAQWASVSYSNALQTSYNSTSYNNSPLPSMQVFEQRAPVNTFERVVTTPSGPPGDVHSGEYVRRLESEINLLREKLHYEQSQREDTAEKFKTSVSKFHQVSEDKFQLEQVLTRTFKDVEGANEGLRKMREEQDQRAHAEAQVASLQKQLKQSHFELEESVNSIKKLSRTLQFKEDEIEDFRKRILHAEERAQTAMERAKAQAREEVDRDVKMQQAAQEAQTRELQRKMAAMAEDTNRDRETLRRKMEEVTAAKEAYRNETAREVERVRAEEERQKSELRAKVNELVQAGSQEKQQLRERYDREKDELRKRIDSVKGNEDREKSDLRRRLDEAVQEKDRSWTAVANLRENLQRCMADLSYANSRLKDHDVKMKERDNKANEMEQNKAKMLQVIEELKRALGETTDLNDAAKEELFFLRGRVRDLEERAAQQPPPLPPGYGQPGRGASPADDYRQRLMSPTNYDTPPLPNNLSTQPDDLRSEGDGSERGYLPVDPSEIDKGVEVHM